MSKTRVGLIGASGETGGSILHGLLENGNFEIIAYVRPSSISKPANTRLKDQGVELRQLDLSKDPQQTLVAALKGVDVLLSAIGPQGQLDQIPLATAAKTAGVKRFVPCGYITVMPAGVSWIRDLKEEVYNHMKRLGVPYTIIDVGWWYQISFPPLPSGKIDYAAGMNREIAGDGNQPSAFTDLRDIGRYVARVIRDERTLNKQVLVYNEMWSQNQVYDLLEKLSGETIPRKYVSLEELEARLVEAKKNSDAAPEDYMAKLAVIATEYMISWGVRGDNTPEYAKYLGYITSKDLYPDFQYVKYEDYMRTLLAGEARVVYEEMRAMVAKALEK